MLQKFALAFKTKTIEFFAEEEEDADDVAASAAAGEGGLLAGQRVVVLKPDPQNPNPSGGEGSGEEAAVAAALATASSFQAAYLHLQAAHSPFLPEAAAAADAAAVSHLRRLSELKRLATGPSDGSLTWHLEAQVRENQALLRSFDAVVNRLQTALDAKDSAATALRREYAALEDSNARLAARLDRALAPGAGGGDAVGSMLSAGLFDSVLRNALCVAHRFTRALAELFRCAGWDLAAAAAAAYPGVVYSKHGHCRYALLSRVCLSMFDGFDSYQFGGTSDTETPEGIELAIRRNESLQQFIEHSDADPMELMNSSPDCEFAQFCDRKYKQLIHPGVESSLFGNSDCRALPVMGAAGPLYELFVAMAFRLKSLDRLLFQGIMMIFQGVIHHMNFRFVWHDKKNINMANPLSMEPAKSANSKEKSSNKKLKEIDGTAVSVGSGNSKKTMSSSGDYSAEGSSDVNDTKVSKTPRKRSLDDGPGAETAASAKMEDVLAPNHIIYWEIQQFRQITAFQLQ